ncbi:MAG TPA: hypothetical protein EYG86_04205 [Crocinitomicaceae bacterium]|nr:hypothetical protein [Crocinitomicaceae bacterium]
MRMLRIRIIFITLFAFNCLSFGQYHTNLSKSELGIMIGGSSYIGDLNQFAAYKNMHLAGGLIYRYNIHSRLSFRANFLYGELSADDASSAIDLYRQRNLNFKTTIYELGVGLEFSYFPFQLGHDRYKGTMYVLAELAVFRMNPKTVVNGAEIELRNLGTEGQGTPLNKKGYYSLTQISIPIGVGAKLSLSKRIGLNLEIGLRKTFTDYIDDVGSDSYVDPVALSVVSSPTTVVLSNRSGNLYGQRGNASNKDWYLFAGAMITFSLGQPGKCYSH